jgi:Ca2+-binding RTX toxin-like protein
MALRIFNTDSIVSGVAINATSNDTIVITEGTTIASTNSAGVTGPAGAFNVSIEVHGTLAGPVRGIDMLDLSGSNTVTIGATGRVIGDTSQAVLLDGSDGVLINRGEISSFAVFPVSTVFFASERAYAHNSGVIRASQGNRDAVNFEGALDASINRLINTGEIISSSEQDTGAANVAVRGDNGAADQVFNTGLITGNVLLQSGEDLYDGRGGRIIGEVLGGTGNDTLYGGLGADRLLGEGNDDTLYFDAEDLRFGVVSGGAGYDAGHYTDDATPITIRLQNHGLEGYYGSAADEVVITGSLGGVGAFILTGAGNDLVDASSQADTINGGAGVDVLYGRDGADTLIGGLGGDWLQGGAGADVFRYNALTDSTVNGQDFIADFSTVDGDKINLDLALEDVGPVTFNTGYGTGTSVYVFGGGGGTSLVQVYTGVTLQMQIVVSQAGLVQSDFVL